MTATPIGPEVIETVVNAFRRISDLAAGYDPESALSIRAGDIQTICDFGLAAVNYIERSRGTDGSRDAAMRLVGQLQAALQMVEMVKVPNEDKRTLELVNLSLTSLNKAVLAAWERAA